MQIFEQFFYNLQLVLIVATILILIFFKILNLKTVLLHINNKKMLITYSIALFALLTVIAWCIKNGNETKEIQHE
jgi:hypothetical protein